MAKKRIAILFGGTSPEHDISCMSAWHLLQNMPAGFETVCIGITRKGRMLYYPGGPGGIRTGEWESYPDSCSCIFSTDDSKTGIYMLMYDGSASYLALDCVFPVLYGKRGEDGKFQGILECSGIPFVGSGACTSALCMDKGFAHMILTAAGIKMSRYITVRRDETLSIPSLVKQIEYSFGFPVYVKPACANTAGGIFHASRPEELERAVKMAFVHDSKVLIKEAIRGRQIKCGLIGNDLSNIEVSPLGEITIDPDFVPETPYESAPQTLHIPADLPEETADLIRRTAIHAFDTAECAGAASIDFFLTESGEVYLNQLNTVPGFSPVSIFPMLWEAAGVDMEELIERLIALAFEKADVEY